MSTYDIERYPQIRESVVAALIAYAERRRPVGDFLTAVLRNDLRDTIGRADDENLAALLYIVRFVYQELPSGCWGSREKIKVWMAHEGLAGLLGVSANG